MGHEGQAKRQAGARQRPIEPSPPQAEEDQEGDGHDAEPGDQLPEERPNRAEPQDEQEEDRSRYAQHKDAS